MLVGVWFCVTSETDIDRNLGARDLPRIAEAKPLVRHLHLPAIVDLLVEDPEFVADAVADRRDLERRERIKVAGREPPEAAVAEPRLFFLVEEFVEIETELLHS